MNLKNRLILEEYRSSRHIYVKLGDVVHQRLDELVRQSDIQVLGIEHRVKAERSLSGKLARKGDRYHSLHDLTDLLGARIICFFSDDVDRMGKLVEKTFVVDWENSTDKRAQIKVDTFGYLSLHYICSLPADEIYPEDIRGKKFEIQVRTALQHTWAVIEHDLGYKSEFGVPRAMARSFARVASLLEIADDEFVRLREDLKAYTDDIRLKITENQADDVLIDTVSLQEYMHRNKQMKAFLQKICAINSAELEEISPESYIEQLAWLGKKTLGSLQQMLSENEDLAYRMAKQALERTDLDILSSNVGLRFLCRAELVNRGYSSEQIIQFLTLATGRKQGVERQANALLAFRQAEKDDA